MEETTRKPLILTTRNYRIPIEVAMERDTTKDKLMGGCALKAYYSQEELIIPDKMLFMGIDPGADFGITLLPWDKHILSFHGKLNKDEQPLQGYAILNEIFRHFIDKHVQLVVIENAAFGAKYGQVSLAEKRTAFILACDISRIPYTKSPPASIRKAVFGSAKITGQQIWANIDPNAADSIAMAFMAFKIFDDNLMN